MILYHLYQKYERRIEELSRKLKEPHTYEEGEAILKEYKKLCIKQCVVFSIPFALNILFQIIALINVI